MHIYDVSTPADVSLVAATAKTVLTWINPSTRRSRVLEIEIGGASITATDGPMLVEIVRYTTDGTGTTSGTPGPRDPGNPAALGSSRYNYSVEPTGGTVAFSTRLSPIGGTLFVPMSPDRFPVTAVSNLIGIRLTSPAAQSGIRASLCVEE